MESNSQEKALAGLDKDAATTAAEFKATLAASLKEVGVDTGKIEPRSALVKQALQRALKTFDSWMLGSTLRACGFDVPKRHDDSLIRTSSGVIVLEAGINEYGNLVAQIRTWFASRCDTRFALEIPAVPPEPGK